MIAGLAFTNVSLGIVHSIAHSCGSLFHISHGKANAIILPFVVDYNSADARAGKIYSELAKDLGVPLFGDAIRKLGSSLGIPASLSELVEAQAFEKNLEELTALSIADGCTKTNPLIPEKEEMTKLLRTIYTGI